jgi:hypothetical protein
MALAGNKEDEAQQQRKQSAWLNAAGSKFGKRPRVPAGAEQVRTEQREKRALPRRSRRRLSYWFFVNIL